MATVEIDKIVSDWSVEEKRTALGLLLNKLLPPITPTAEQRQSAREELARRYATRQQAVDVNQVLGRRAETD